MSANISIFVPHNGCPNQCSFCNQFSITSHLVQPGPNDVDEAVEIAVNSMGDACKESEIAFFGGSFTAIKKDYMVSLLQAAYKYVKPGIVRGIRISTRPDAIDNEVLSTLKKYGVTTIELGAQCMDDNVLIMNRRGHSVDDVYNASRLIKQNGFALGLQMMTGLYGSSDEHDINTCREFIGIKPDCVRIYPTIVLKNTMLAELYKSGAYEPQSVEHAVELCSKLLPMFNEASIPVIRLGLHTIDENDYVAGPWHPAFGELCEGRIFYDIIKKRVEPGKSYIIGVSPSSVSKAIGQKRTNILSFANDGIKIKVVSDQTLSSYEIKVKEVIQ